MKIINNGNTSYCTDDYIADKVCDGWFGNGEDRRNRLEAAGYDYDKIQEIVNKKMNSNRLEELRRNHQNMSNYRILKAMITECLSSNDISYVNMILNLAETIVDNATNQNEDEDEDEDEPDD